MKDGANERRFELDDTYDKSQYLSNVMRHKHLMPFRTVKGRENDNLIAKGGDFTRSLGGKSSIFYNTKKEKTMDRLEKSVPAIGKTTKRINFQSIYKKESAPDYYDSVKVAETQTKMISTGKKPFVDMKKQTKRKFEDQLNKTDFHRNVLRDNARQDYIKNLLEAK